MSSRPDLSSAHWVKSSHSTDGGQCIEVAPGFPSVMPVRDSKYPHGPALVFPADAWQAFVSSLYSYGEVLVAATTSTGTERPSFGI